MMSLSLLDQNLGALVLVLVADKPRLSWVLNYFAFVI